MKKLILIFALLASFALQATPSVSLSVARPETSVTTIGGGKKSKNSRSPQVTEKNISNNFHGKIRCNLPKDEKALITVEAYFVTRAIGKKGAKDEMSPKTEVGKYEFGGENPPQYEFDISSPQVTEKETVTTKGGRRRHGRSSGSTIEKKKEGSRFMGVMVRAIADGKVLKVITYPTNPHWLKAGKMQYVDLDAVK